MTDEVNAPTEGDGISCVRSQSEKEITKLLDFFKSSCSLYCLYILSPDVNAMFRNILSNFISIEAAGGLVINGNDQVLLIKRSGIWDLPKGKMEQEEEPEKTAVREVEEECGVNGLQLQRHLTNTFHTYVVDGEWILKKTYWFKMRINNSPQLTPQLEEDITEAVWVNPQELPHYLNNTYETIRDVFTVAGMH